LEQIMPRKRREEEIINAIRIYLEGAVSCLEPITDMRLMKAAGCARATYYKYVTKGSEIQLVIEAARIEQKKYAESVRLRGDTFGDQLTLHERLGQAEEGDRELLAFITRMTANLIRYGVPIKYIQAAQREAMPHPGRSSSHAGKGHRKN
jgi:hypothetical protein